MPKHPVQPIQLGYIIFAGLMFLLLITFVPRRRIQKLFWFSLLWGPMVNILMVWTFQALNLYHYEYLKPFEFLGTPIFNSLAWSPAIILFIHFLPERTERYVVPLYIALYSMLGTLIGAYFTEFGLVEEVHFHYVLRLPIWYLWFSATLWHYYKLFKPKVDC